MALTLYGYRYGTFQNNRRLIAELILGHWTPESPDSPTAQAPLSVLKVVRMIGRPAMVNQCLSLFASRTVETPTLRTLDKIQVLNVS